MLIDKIINNNIVSASDGEGREVVVMGRGIGFGMKPGKEIPENRLKKSFESKAKHWQNSLKIFWQICQWSMWKYPAILLRMQKKIWS